MLQLRHVANMNRYVLKMSMTPASGGGDIRQKALDVQCVGIRTLSQGNERGPR